MNELSHEQKERRQAYAVALLEPQGWVPMGYMLFFKGGKVYDLSAADIEQADQIERDGLFIVADDSDKNGESPLLRFEDIPQLTHWGNYEVDIEWASLEKTLADFGKDYGLDLNPDFQRGHVWSRDKQVAYVEFMLRGGNSAKTLLFNCPVFGNPGASGIMQIVDGKQRLEAVRRFLRDDLPAFGHTFREYDGRLRGTGARFRIYVNDLPTRAQVLRWYLEINQGGVVHTLEELHRVMDLLKQEEAQADGNGLRQV